MRLPNARSESDKAAVTANNQSEKGAPPIADNRNPRADGLDAAAVQVGFLLDEITIHLVPVVLGRGVSLFGGLDLERFELSILRIIDAFWRHAPHLWSRQIMKRSIGATLASMGELIGEWEML